MANTEKFTLHNVYTTHAAWAVLIAIPCMLFFGVLYYIFLGENFRLGFVMIFTALCVGTIIFIIKKASKDVTIWFNEDYMFIQKGNEKQQKYLKTDISGFYSYDYETKTSLLKTSLIKMKFILKDGTNIYLNDSEYRNKYDDEKARVLEKIIQTVQQELGFKKIKSAKFSNVYWYSKL